MKWTYLLINLGSILIPFIFSFHPKLKFSSNWKSAWLSIIIVLIPFVIWDVYFTKIGVWWFNLDYTLGITLFNLPLEEWLFFICIPYATLFTYHCFKRLLTLSASKLFVRIWLVIITAFVLLSCFLFKDRMYTLTTSVLLLTTLLFLLYSKVVWLKPFFITFTVILIPFFIVNGLLTGWLLDSPVVLYNDSENIGFRLNTIPIEDVFYGCLLLILNTAVYELLISIRISKSN